MTEPFVVSESNEIYRLEGGLGWETVTDKIFVSDDPHRLRPKGVTTEPCFYIEPCGQFPGGFYVPVRHLEELLNAEYVVPHFYDWGDPEREEAIKEEGIGFDILAESETDEADVIERRLTLLGGFVL